jgi:hypothetical protein
MYSIVTGMHKRGFDMFPKEQNDFNRLSGYDVQTCYALFLLQLFRCLHISWLPFKCKKFKYPGALISHCVGVNDPEIYHLTG